MITVTNKSLIKEALISKEKALTTSELVELTNLPLAKIRQTLTTWEYEIVRVGPQTYDLADRVYPGKTFRYTPTKLEIEKGVLLAEADLMLFLTAAHDFSAEITLIDEDNQKYKLTKSQKASEQIPFRHYQRLTKWFRKVHFEAGDDILFTCLDIETHTFRIHRQKQGERDELMIHSRNKQLADVVFDILNHSISKYESDLFLVRKYLYIYPFHEPIPPDHFIKALTPDKRFLISKNDQMLSWTGHLLDNWLTVGLRKYYFKNDMREWVPVLIDEDKWGKFGFCSQCNEKLVWDEESGWQHSNTRKTYNLDTIFLRFGHPKSRKN